MGNRLKLPKVVARRKPRLVPNKSVIRRRESSHIGDPFIDDPLVGDPLAEASRLAADAIAEPMTLDGVAGKSTWSLLWSWRGRSPAARAIEAHRDAAGI
jgi:hypothetical protein